MSAIRIVFRRFPFIVLAGTIAIIVLLFAISLPNLSFLRHALTSEILSFNAKVEFYWSYLGILGTNFTLFSRTLTIFVSILTGMYLSMFAFYVKTRISEERSGGSGIAGTLLGMLGVGCASCGSVILTSIFGLGATTGFIGVLPFRGLEFGIIGGVILLFAMHLLSRKILNPTVCRLR